MYVELIYYLILIPSNKCAISSNPSNKKILKTKDSKDFVEYPVRKHTIKLVLLLFFNNQTR
jgi:hypothetical protein